MYYNTYLNHINVDISKDLIYLNKWCKKHRKNEWIQRQHNWKNGKLIEHQHIGNMLMQDHFVISNGATYTIRNKNKKMRDQLKLLEQYEAEIINKLRTDCINLNGYKKYRFGETSGK